MKLKKELQSANDCLQTQGKDIIALEKKVDYWQYELSQKSIRNAMLEALSEHRTEERDELMAERDSLSDERDELKAERDGLKDKQDRSNDERDGLKTECKRLKHELKSLIEISEKAIKKYECTKLLCNSRFDEIKNLKSRASHDL